MIPAWFRRLPGYARLRAARDRRAFRAFTPDDERRRRFYAGLIRPGDLVFDVGANLGNRVKVFLRLGARVVAFEPQARCADLLDTVLAGRPDARLVRQALGARPGTAEMRIADAHTLSSLSDRWIEATVRSGRFAARRWPDRQPVAVTTLDACIREFGRPAFIKIDVEGYEAEVLAGLSEPVPAVSFEFTPELMETARTCIDRLDWLGGGRARFQVALGESMVFALPDWVSADAVKAALAALPAKAMGDVYARLPTAAAGDSGPGFSEARRDRPGAV